MDRAKFYHLIRDTFHLTNNNVKGFEFILTEAEKRDIHTNHLAYILATVWHETASTMQPIAEYGKGIGKKYGAKDKNGQVPYGRGYGQLTWTTNYERADKELNLGGALIKNYELAMEPEIAIQILFKGMAEGWFTGKGLDDYIDDIDEDDKEDLREFANARRIINGIDKQVVIGQYALVFERALKGSDYVAGALMTKPVETEPVVILEPNKPIPTDTEIVLTLRRSDIEKISLFDFYMAIKELVGDNK